MPPKGKQANGSSEKKAAPAPAPPKPVGDEPPATKEGRVTKPDQAAYQAEQDALKKQIDELQAKLNTVKDSINLTKGGAGNARRDELRAQLDEIRKKQASNKTSRGKLLDQAQNAKAQIDEKIKALNATKSKVPYKSVQEVDNQITRLEKNVESGSMKVVDEKKALAEISSLRRVRKTVEGFQASQEEIDADRKKLEELRKELDDPEAKAMSEQFDTIKAELDQIKKDSDIAYGNRNQLFDERTQLSTELEKLWTEKKENQAAYRAAQDAWYKQANEDRARRAEKIRAQKAAEEETKRREVAEQLLEEARNPAYAADIQDCQTLIDYFANKSGTSEAAPSSGLVAKSELVGVPKLELRQVDSTGLIVKKKKGEDEENYFVAKKKQPAPKKGASNPAPVAPKESGSSQQLQLPFGTLSGLLHLSIPPPANAGDVPRVIEDLKTKKAWFQANQARVTNENIAKAEAQIEKLSKGKAKEGDAPSEAIVDAVEEPEAGPA